MLAQTKIKETMNFSLNEDQILLQETIRDFVEKEVKPYAKSWDEKEDVPLSTIKNIRTGVNVNPTIETLIPLANYFNVSLDDIVQDNLAGSFSAKTLVFPPIFLS